MRLLCFVGLFVLGSLCGSEGQVIELEEQNWERVLSGEWMLEFYAPWCPACRALQSSWEEFASWSEDLHLKGIAQIDVTKSPGLSGRFMVTALPTIFHVKEGEFRQYRGSRDKEAFIAFIEEEKWKEIETIPSWKDPRSFQMTAVSYFFKMSMFLRNAHSTITEVYNFPTWASYLGFAIATVALGAFLGLVLVCCIDFVCPPQKNFGVVVSQPDDDEKDATDQDDIKDDVVEDDTESKPTAIRKRKAKKAE
ncbi:Thioredoxin-related transmembrane protein 1 [Lepeophtheirus salmonis]|uniref:Thioredoxin domain-containing protein 1 n=1 Tax=Lepeophtheirus salmonis TaxID=72036 RepID=C1BUP1_LEPSM|nr:Thioredoxin domain-containing protein 1 precursor [Lepeophtheirus salmonis]ADD24034.1 Thioredoxin-related transmembrane protein 1 [Lepeophtheirus salmonis]CAB4064228.1 Thioredoxin-related transmembrane protein 1 [Lepeophtheirus salmonis]CAF2938251.1 Thioredoxin-related transmembrane protein 1 [Lepeophtheirus salmonis]